MKFNCVISDTTIGGHKSLFGLLREQNDGSGKHIFIVPDRYTLGVEKEICETLYPDGAFNVDVCSFTRLAQKALGKKDRACLSKEGTVLLLNRVIEDNDSSLIYYKDIKSVSFSREMFASIASLRSSGISAELAEEQGKAIGGALGDKLHDVALLYRAYEEQLRQNYFDTITRVEWLIENLSSSEEVKNSHLYVLGFNVFSDRQMEFIKRALIVCPSVSVSFCSSQKGSNTHCFPHDQREKLIQFCQSAGIPIEIRESTEVLPPVFSFLHNEAFGKSRAVFRGDASAVRVCGYLNVYEEIKAIAREIAYSVREGGYRYRDIAVACNDPSYNTIIAKTFSRYGISYFIDQKYQVKNGFFARFVGEALACKDSNMDVRDVMRLVRHPYSGFDREQIQTFENYCTRYSVNYSLFDKPFEDDAPEFVRQKTTDRIRSLPLRAPVKEYCDVILAWAKEEEFLLLELAFAQGKSTEEKVYAQKDKFVGVIGEISALCGEKQTDVGEFRDMLDSVLSDMTVSVLPQYLDAVFIGNTSESRFGDVKLLFVAGANDGFFPITTGDKLIFGSYDTEIMRKNGLQVFPSPEETNFFEQFAVIDLFSKAQRLYLSYALSSANGDGLSEGNGVREVKYRLNLAEKPFERYYDLGENEKLVYRFATPENCYFEYTAGYVPAEYRESVREFLIAEGYLSGEENAERPYDLLKGYARTKKGEYKLSVSKMETYFLCPFKNYVTNVLGLREKEESGLKVNDKGTIIHAALERYFGRADFLRTATEEERAKFGEKCVEEAIDLPEYRRFKENAVAERELKGIREECRRVFKTLTENMLHSAFTPRWTEKRFGDEGELVFRDGEDEFVFTGVVDRVDEFDNQIIIIDYKTGASDEDLEKVYSGRKIQLYLYGKYFADRGFDVVGVFYLPIPDGFKREKTSYAMIGQIVNDPNLFLNLDDRAKETQNGRYWSPNVNFGIDVMDGIPRMANKNKKNLLFKEDFTTIGEYVIRLIRQAIREIKEGYIEKKPVYKGCEYCPCSKICGERGERKTPGVTPESFAEGEDAVE